MRTTHEILYYDFGKFRLDVVQRCLFKDGKPLRITHKTFLILSIFVKNAGSVIKKDDIISEVGSDCSVEEANISQHVYRLRKILETDAQGKSYIETITRRGFRFSAPVKEIPAFKKPDIEPLNSKIIADDKLRIEQKSLPLTQEKLSKNNYWRLQFFLIAMLIMGLISVVAYFYKIG